MKTPCRCRSQEDYQLLDDGLVYKAVSGKIHTPFPLHLAWHLQDYGRRSERVKADSVLSTLGHLIWIDLWWRSDFVRYLCFGVRVEFCHSKYLVAASLDSAPYYLHYRIDQQLQSLPPG